MFCNVRYKPNWHHYVIADYAERLSRGEIKRLAIEAPPRHGKTEIISVSLPPWHLGLNSFHDIIATSVDAKLAEKNGKRARNIVASTEFKQIFPQCKLSEESAAKLVWTIEENFEKKPCPHCGTVNWHKKPFGRAICRTCGRLGEFAGSHTLGEYFGAGIEGNIVGRGANLFIIDDPFKNRKQVKSFSQRESVWEWYISAAVTRLEEDSRLCIINTRWHEDDLTGRVLRNSIDVEDYEPWTQLTLKAVAEENEEWIITNPDYCERFDTDRFHRKKGEPLWESKYPIKRLYSIRNEIKNYEFSAQYQQNPHPPEGSMFKFDDFRYADIEGNYYLLYNNDGSSKKVLIKNCIRFITGDLNYVEGQDSSFTVFCTWDLTPNSDLILMDMFREQVDGARHLSILWQLYRRNEPQEIAIEDTGYQISLIQSAILEGLPATKLGARGSKESRALSAGDKMLDHKFYMLNSLPQLHIIEQELVNFPSGEHKDIVDNFAYAAIRAATITKIFYAAPPPPERNEYSITNRRKVLEGL
jgi:hypothetical protein